MATTSEKIAALAVELENENAALRQRVSELQSIISEGIQQNSNCPGVLVALTPPSSIAFGQRWAIVFTIGPNNTHDPSLDLNELPRCGLYLGTDDLNQDE